VPRDFSCGRGVIPSLAERRGGAVLAAYVSVGTTSLECSVLECGQVYSTERAAVYAGVGNVFRSGSSSERHHGKRRASRAAQQMFTFPRG
jgi:hypothetical protein